MIPEFFATPCKNLGHGTALSRWGNNTQGTMTHHCPCCGYEGLETKAYAHLPERVLVRGGQPPYSSRFGFPSHEVCPCCGYEFGNDDEPGTGEPSSFDSYFHDWQASGCEWLQENRKPHHWTLQAQIQDLPTI